MNKPLYILKKSKIRNAGIGAFANQAIKKAQCLGEYSGKLVTAETFDKMRKTEYVFQVNKKGKLNHFINGRHGNWITRINGAKTKQQEKKVNVESYQYRQKIYYKTTRPVSKGEEFIVSYGDEYWI